MTDEASAPALEREARMKNSADKISIIELDVEAPLLENQPSK